MITPCVHYIFLLRGCVKNSTCVTENLWYLHFCREIESALYIRGAECEAAPGRRAGPGRKRAGPGRRAAPGRRRAGPERRTKDRGTRGATYCLK